MQSGSNSSNLLQINELLKRITNSQEEIQKLFGETDMQNTARRVHKALICLDKNYEENSEVCDRQLEKLLDGLDQIRINLKRTQDFFGEFHAAIDEASKASQLLSDETQNNSENREEKPVIKSTINDGIFDHQNLSPLYVPLPEFDIDSIKPQRIIHVIEFSDDPIKQKRAERRQKTICALRNVCGVRSVEPDQSPQ